MLPHIPLKGTLERIVKSLGFIRRLVDIDRQTTARLGSEKRESGPTVRSGSLFSHLSEDGEGFIAQP